ncbi:MAG: hypothetical protein HC802_01015 [Caldilineaceae bacterium]|nr:hypothetical protein [Caldilineaceae bacterium]
MRVFGWVLLGVIGGAILGAAVGIALGLAYVELFDVSCFEGYCGFLVAFAYGPIGMLIGAVTIGIFAFRKARQSS